MIERTNISIEKGLKKKAKTFCAKRGLNFSEYVALLIEMSLAKKDLFLTTQELRKYKDLVSDLKRILEKINR